MTIPQRPKEWPGRDPYVPDAQPLPQPPRPSRIQFWVRSVRHIKWMTQHDLNMVIILPFVLLIVFVVWYLAGWSLFQTFLSDGTVDKSQYWFYYLQNSISGIGSALLLALMPVFLMAGMLVTPLGLLIMAGIALGLAYYLGKIVLRLIYALLSLIAITLVAIYRR